MGIGGADDPDRQTSLTDGSASRDYASLDPGTGTREGGSAAAAAAAAATEAAAIEAAEGRGRRG